jgi:hypothetical protein
MEDLLLLIKDIKKTLGIHFNTIMEEFGQITLGQIRVPPFLPQISVL